VTKIESDLVGRCEMPTQVGQRCGVLKVVLDSIVWMYLQLFFIPTSRRLAMQTVPRASQPQIVVQQVGKFLTGNQRMTTELDLMAAMMIGQGMTFAQGSSIGIVR
jgi:hypothetical protein